MALLRNSAMVRTALLQNSYREGFTLLIQAVRRGE